MNGPIRTWMWCAIFAAVTTAGGLLHAQEEPAAPEAPAAKPPAAAPKAAAKAPANADAKPGAKTPAPKAPVVRSPYRRLAPGVVRSIDPTRKAEETVARHDITELLAVDPNFEWAKDVPFRHSVWMLELKFKPIRIFQADVLRPSGVLQKKPIWYMIYSVTNPGKVWEPVEEPDRTFKLVSSDKPIRFSPIFRLEAHTWLPKPLAPDMVAKISKMKEKDRPKDIVRIYTDRLLPLALGPIRTREDAKRPFLSTAQMCEKPIEVGQTVWGIVTWDGPADGAAPGAFQEMDPRTVWFSVYIAGLTNAYRWKDDPAKYKPNAEKPAEAIGTGRDLYRKVLKLNFWRPGDEFNVSDEDIRFGLPPDVPDAVDYEWVFCNNDWLPLEDRSAAPAKR